MIDLDQLDANLRQQLPEWSNRTLAVIADVLALELQRRGFTGHVGVGLASMQLRGELPKSSRAIVPGAGVARPAEPIHGDNCAPKV